MRDIDHNLYVVHAIFLYVSAMNIIRHVYALAIGKPKMYFQI